MNSCSFNNLLDYVFNLLYSTNRIDQMSNDIQNDTNDEAKIKLIFNTQYRDIYEEINESETDSLIVHQNFSSDDKAIVKPNNN